MGAAVAFQSPLRRWPSSQGRRGQRWTLPRLSFTPPPRSLPGGALPPGRRAPGCPAAGASPSAHARSAPWPGSPGPSFRSCGGGGRESQDRREGASGVPAPHLLLRVFSRLRSGPVGLPGTLQGPAGLFKAEAAEGGGEGEGGRACSPAPPPLWLPEPGEEATLPSAGRCCTAVSLPPTARRRATTWPYSSPRPVGSPDSLGPLARPGSRPLPSPTGAGRAARGSARPSDGIGAPWQEFASVVASFAVKEEFYFSPPGLTRGVQKAGLCVSLSSPPPRLIRTSWGKAGRVPPYPWLLPWPGILSRILKNAAGGRIWLLSAPPAPPRPPWMLSMAGGGERE